jgi:hypothetical protein
MITWDTSVDLKFKQMIAKVPVFLRGIAEEKVSKKAISLACQEGHPQVSEKDMVDAFFSETPFGFHGPLKADMDELGINYKQYGY